MRDSKDFARFLERQALPAAPAKPPAGPLKPVLVMDMETDPFLFQRVPLPFVVGFYRVDPPRVAGGDSREIFEYVWGDDCIEQAISYLAALRRKYIIYAHNGGKFDYLYFADYLSPVPGSLKIINGRIVSSKLCGHEIRDSYAIMPFPLRDYKKDELDYSKLERESRDRHRSEILSYLKGDCRYLHDLVSAFHSEFGQARLTIGSTAMTEIKKRHPITRTGLAFDRAFRPKFFFGGRVQCMKTGIINAPVSIYDVNSMYPSVMKAVDHPASDQYRVGREISAETVFLQVSGYSHGCFPVRDDGAITFPHTRGEFHTSIHEFNAGVATGTFEPDTILKTWDFYEQQNFAAFVTEFHAMKKKFQESGDAIRELIFKYLINAGYGKFAQNPTNFFEWTIARFSDRPVEECQHCGGSGTCYQCFECQALNDYETPKNHQCMFCLGSGEAWHCHEFNGDDLSAPMLWRKQTFAQAYFNVATGASITAAARAELLRGLAASDGPIYCDTDSIITTGRFRGSVDPSKLGAWKFEGSGVVSAIAGKKLYAIFADTPPVLSQEKLRKFPWMAEPVLYRGRKLYCIKKAHKGLRLSPAEILRVAGGRHIESFSAAPSFRIFGDRNPYHQHSGPKPDPRFIKRTAKSTGTPRPAR